MGFAHELALYLLRVIVTTAFSTLVSALAGYALAKLRFPGRDFLFSIIIIGIMLLPTTTMLVPQFVVLKKRGLVNNYLMGSPFSRPVA